MATKLRAEGARGGRGLAIAAGSPTSEAVFVRNDSVSLCLMINRRARTMRVIDFRAGASPSKKVFVQSIAQRERIDKVVALVERDECASWAKLGFVREGNIPGFYKRSDAFIMGYLVPPPGAPVAPERAPSVAKTRVPFESGVFTVGSVVYGAATSDEDDDDELEVEKAPRVAPNAVAEKTVVHAKKAAKSLGPSMSVKLSPIHAAELLKRVALATREGRALTGFEPFGRDVRREDLLATGKGMELVVGVEVQNCYQNAFVEPLVSPRDDRERAFAIAALGATCERLLAAEIVCAFGLSAVTDVRLATAYVASGFRRTGILRKHLRSGPKGERVDAILWSRKLADPRDQKAGAEE